MARETSELGDDVLFCSQFLQNKQYYQLNLSFGPADSEKFNSRNAHGHIHPHLKTHLHSSDIAIHILFSCCLLVTHNIIR